MAEDLIICARSYLGTRFKHQGRLKKTAQHRGGIDCLGLLVGIASELNLKGKNGETLLGFDTANYSHRPDTAELRKRLETLLIPLPLREGLGEGWSPHYRNQSPPPTQPSPSRGEDFIRPGDIALFEVDGAAQHMGILSDYSGGLGIIHAYAPARCVVEHALDAYWQEKLVAVFRLT